MADPLAGARLFLAHELLRLLPTGAASAVGGWLAPRVGPRLHPRVDGRIRAGIRALRPDLAKDDAALVAAATRAWSSVGRSYAEFSVEDRVWTEGRVRVEGEEHLLAVGAQDRPLIVVGVHTGNWELLPITVAWLGRPVVSVYQPPRNRFEDRIAERSRRRAERAAHAHSPNTSLQLVAPSPTAGFELLRAIRAGRTLAIFGDESVRGRVRTPAFGREPQVDNNFSRVARLARLTGAAVVPAYVVREPGRARYVVRFLPPVLMRATDHAAADVRVNAAALDAVLTIPVLEHLDQWYMLIDLHLQD